ncbi:MAG: HIT family protein [Ktedonobacteraceae bacterium]
MECFTCQNIAGIRRISPGPFIYEGQYWLVDHAYPTSLKGWLVIVLKRHAEALHELSKEELHELADIQYQLAQVMSANTSTDKEYMMCFAESEHHQHIHIHFIAKPKDLPPQAKGAKVFSLLNVDQQHAVPPVEIQAFSEELQKILSSVFGN